MLFSKYENNRGLWRYVMHCVWNKHVPKIVINRKVYVNDVEYGIFFPREKGFFSSNYKQYSCFACVKIWN